MRNALGLLVLLPLCSVAQNMPLESPEHVRAVYDQTSALPDGLAFVSTIRMLAVMNDADNASALNVIERGVGLTGVEAQEFLSDILAAYDSFNADYDAYTKQLLCPTNKARPVGDEIYPLFEAMDDAQETLGTKHLDAFSAELGKDEAARLHAWLVSRKHSITHVKIQYKPHYEEARAIPDEKLYDICERLESIQ